MVMGRPRAHNKDLPPFLHRKPGGTFYFRGPIGDKITYHGFKAKAREAAIAEYWKFRALTDSGEDGTLGEIIDSYTTHPGGLARVKSAVTRAEYTRQLPKIRKRWGLEPYALTAEMAIRGKFLKTVMFDDYLRSMEAQRGATMANHDVRLVSALFTFAIKRSMTAYNPVLGVAYNTETPRKTVEDQAALDKTIKAANAAVRLMLELASVTSISQGDIRTMTLPQIGELLDMERSKTGVEQEWEITPYVRSIFERAKTLPGRHKSIFVFPKPDGQPYSKIEFQSAFRYARKKAGATFQFRDIRKWNIRKATADGQDPQEFAAHKDRRTTDRHYLNHKKHARPLK